MTRMTLWNNTDLDLVDRGLLHPAGLRVEHLEALVDTGATTLVIPIDVCRRLGLRRVRTVPVRLADGTDREMDYMGSIFLRILDREMTCDALAAPEGTNRSSDRSRSRRWTWSSIRAPASCGRTRRTRTARCCTRCAPPDEPALSRGAATPRPRGRC